MNVIIVSFGAGTNSTAMLIGMVLKGELPPYAILFADTGAERPETYAFIVVFSEWLSKQGYPPITIVRQMRQDGTWEGLEAECLRRGALPSLAYGYKTCSQKFKIQPQTKWANNDDTCKAAWKRGEKVIKLIGFDADEPWRGEPYEDEKFVNRYPLLEWDWGRDECVKAIEECQLPLPGKSACFFCPNNSPGEINALGQAHPDLLNRALAMEENADLTTIKGLGRGKFSWRDVVNQGDLWTGFFDYEQPCGCYDGEGRVMRSDKPESKGTDNG